MSSSVQWSRDPYGYPWYWNRAESRYIYSSGHRWDPYTQTLTPPSPQQTQHGASHVPRTPTSQHATLADLPPESGSSPLSYPSPLEEEDYPYRARTQSFSSVGSNPYNPQVQHGPLQPSAGAIPIPSSSQPQGPRQGSGAQQLPPDQRAGYSQMRSLPVRGGNPVAHQGNYPSNIGLAQSWSPTVPLSSSPTTRDWQPGWQANTMAPLAAGGPPSRDQYQGQAREIHREIRGTEGEYEKLDPRYKKRLNKFFAEGRVFKMHWSQPADENTATVTEIKDSPVPKEYVKMIPREYVRDRRFGQYIFSKIRWFIVVQPRGDCSLCVPIVTNKGQGVGKEGVVKNRYAIVHTFKAAPDPHTDELPRRGERPMRDPIRVVPDQQGDKLLPMSRIDYGRVYTVEHNVKAMEFGMVHPGSLKDLNYDFRNVLIGDEGDDGQEEDDDNDDDDNENSSDDSSDGNDGDDDRKQSSVTPRSSNVTASSAKRRPDTKGKGKGKAPLRKK